MWNVLIASMETVDEHFPTADTFKLLVSEILE